MRGETEKQVPNALPQPLPPDEVTALQQQVLEAQRAGAVHKTLKAYRKLRNSVPHSEVRAVIVFALVQMSCQGGVASLVVPQKKR
jgi:hypothetical protein